MKKIIIAILLLFAAFLAAAAFLLSGNQAANAQDCNSFSYSSCPGRCVVCPPCEVCSSLVCETEGYCKSKGFDRNWLGPQKNG